MRDRGVERLDEGDDEQRQHERAGARRIGIASGSMLTMSPMGSSHGGTTASAAKPWQASILVLMQRGVNLSSTQLVVRASGCPEDVLCQSLLRQHPRRARRRTRLEREHHAEARGKHEPTKHHERKRS